MCECVFSSTQLISCKYILSSDSSWCFSNTPKSRWVTRGKSSRCDLDPPVWSLETEETIGNRLAIKGLSHYQDSPFSSDVATWNVDASIRGKHKTLGRHLGRGGFFQEFFAGDWTPMNWSSLPFFSQRVLIGLIFCLFSMKQTFQDRSQSRVVP